jgi:hypothetical protein
MLVKNLPVSLPKITPVDLKDGREFSQLNQSQACRILKKRDELLG